MIFKKVPNRQKPAFPGNYFDNPLFDIKVFGLADRMIKGYIGGSWDYMLCGDVAFMCLDGGPCVLINPISGGEVAASQELAGMIVTSYAMVMAVESGRASDRFVNLLYNLQDLIRDRCEEEGDDIWMIMMD